MALSAHDELILLRKRARRRLVGAVVLVTVSTGVLWNVVGHLPDQQMRPESVEIASEASGTPAEAALPPAVHVATASAPAVGKSVASAPALLAASAPAVKSAGTQLPADLNSVVPDKPAANVVAPAAVAAVATAGAIATGQAKAKAAEGASQPLVHEPPKKKVASKPLDTHPPVAAESKPAKVEKPAPAKHKQPDPAAILAGHFDDEPASKPSAVKKSESKLEKVDNVGNGKSVIQLAALSDPAKADALKNKLSALGVSAHFSKVQTSKGEVTRVRVGPFASRAEAEAALRKLSQAGVSGIVVSK
ncbi:SPOR domain-containing protein [Aquitalea sp. LB_tupeE]|uniref:SPOR domain-containing protein n=1 Tax=Aquitalea sp. LB_tupeE TaxID=2748078 RepID=UPI0015C10FD8|nr:SPOR domain-containing protein [Aquitalea sp. LB_tupeE]NWK76343.1 SPOR domain-containing protein [Aquitalea sp. LB_tupeE]